MSPLFNLLNFSCKILNFIFFRLSYVSASAPTRSATFFHGSTVHSGKSPFAHECGSLTQKNQAPKGMSRPKTHDELY